MASMIKRSERWLEAKGALLTLECTVEEFL